MRREVLSDACIAMKHMGCLGILQSHCFLNLPREYVRAENTHVPTFILQNQDKMSQQVRFNSIMLPGHNNLSQHC